MTLSPDASERMTGYVDTGCTVFMMICAVIILTATARRSLGVLSGRFATALEPSEA